MWYNRHIAAEFCTFFSRYTQSNTGVTGEKI